MYIGLCRLQLVGDGAYVVIKSLMIRTSSLNGMLLLFNDISAL